ncbi:hypothetical protein JKP88DRAFT_278129 [Tribonema minus]|uniref:Plastid lipid-associated protein/fibrillin conserved domain-containing protein n=1 Tax=Tribonema minus TaxID=303371 RepID=A0A836CE93_9STRA|nr:hypothetical protein JKP88DRAFT_278129 [Tribonema minus]
MGSSSKEKKSNGGGALDGAEFERQELKVIFRTMEENDIHFQQLGPEQTDTIQAYVDKILAAGSPMTPKAVVAGDGLVGKWRLEYSTEQKYKILPPGSDVYTYVYDPKGGRLDTILMFPRSPIVKSIQVICDYTISTNGVLDFVFKKTIVDIFGFSLPVPTFGTPNAFLEMQYFDGDLWMEQFDEPAPNGEGVKKSVNVYRKIGSLTEADKAATIKAYSKNTLPTLRR